MQLSYPEFVLLGILDQAGWPKESGFIRKSRSVSAGALDAGVQSTLVQMFILGGAYSECTLKLIAHLFPERDWSASDAAGNSSDDLVQEIFRRADSMIPHETERPWEALFSPMFFTEAGSPEGNVPWRTVASSSFRNRLTMNCVYSLVWAFLEPLRVKQSVEHYFADALQNIETLQQFGLEFTVPSLDFFASAVDAREIFDVYEDTYGRLPEVPVGLLNSSFARSRTG